MMLPFSWYNFSEIGGSLLGHLLPFIVQKWNNLSNDIIISETLVPFLELKRVEGTLMLIHLHLYKIFEVYKNLLTISFENQLLVFFSKKSVICGLCPSFDHEGGEGPSSHVIWA
jgi:hypothetical protein